MDLSDKIGLTDIAENFDVSNDSLKEFLATASPDQLNIDSYKQWATNVNGLGKSFNFAAIGAKALNLALNAGIMFLAVKGVELLVTTIGNYINRVEVAKETMEESAEAYKTTKQELSDITSELEAQNKRMDELLAKDTPTYVEQSELDKLKEATKELEYQKALKEKMQEEDAIKLAHDASDAYSKEYGTGFKEEAVDRYYAMGTDGSQTWTDLGMDDKNVAALIAQYRILGEYRDEANASGSEWFEEYNQEMKETETILWDNVENLENYKKALESVPQNNLTSDQKTDLEEIKNVIRSIWTELDPNKWNQIKFDGIFNTPGIEKTKDQLIEMKKAGTLDEASVASFKNLDTAIKESGLTAGDFCNEINALADAQDDLAESQIETPDFSTLFSSLPIEKLEEFISLFNAGEIDEKTISSYSELSRIMEQTGLSAADSVKAMKEFAEGFTLPTDIISNLQDAKDLIEDLGKIKGTFDTSSLENVVKLYPQMQSAVSDYIVGLMTEGQLIDELASHYETDMQNYGNYMIAKNADNLNFANTVGLNSSEVVNQFSTDYGIDIGNHTTYAQKKILIEQQTLQTISNMWSKYYNAQSMSLTKAGQMLEDDILSGNGANDPKALELYNKLNTQTKVYKEAMNALNNVVYEGVGANFNKISNSGSKGGSKKEKSPKEETKKEIDWIERRNKLLQEQHDELKEISDDETISYRDRIDAINDLINADKQRLEFAKQAAAKYAEAWAKAKESLSDAEIANIMTGGIDITEYKSENAEKIQAGIDAYDSMTEYEDELSAIMEETNDHLREQIQLREEVIKAQQDSVQAEMDILQSRMDLRETRGGVITAGMYKEQIALSKELSRSYGDQIDNLREQLDMVDYGSAEYYSLRAQISECESAILDCKTQQEEWNEQIMRLPIDRLQKYLNELANIKQDFQNFLDEQSALGINPTADQLQQLFELSQDEISSLLEQQEKLKDLLDEYQYGSEKFNEVSGEIQDIDDQISSLIQSQAEWNEQMLRIPLDQFDKLNDTLNTVNGAIGDISDGYDSVLSAVTNVIDKQKEAVEELKESTNDLYQDKIDPLQEELDIMQKQNKERELQLAHEQSLYDLDRAKNQKVNQVVRNGKVGYEEDFDAVRDAEQSAADSEYNKIVHDLETQITGLEEERDALLEGYDEQIEKLDEIKDRWSSIASDIADATDKLKADEMLGDGWEDKIISGNDGDIYDIFKGMYENTENQKNQIEEQIASNERIAEMMNQFVTLYQNGSITYEQAMAGIKDLSLQMKDGYSVLDYLDDFIGLNGSDDISSLLENMQNSANDAVGQLGEYMGFVEKNSDIMDKYTKTWEEMQADIASQIEALKKAAEALEKLANNQSHSGSGSGSSGSGSGGGSGGSGGGYVESGPGFINDVVSGNQSAVDSWESGNTGGASSDLQDMVNDKLENRHTGIEAGLVGESNDETIERLLKQAATTNLKPGESYIKAMSGEAVFTGEQQKALLDNLYNNYTPMLYQFTPPDLSDLTNDNNRNQNIEFNMGDIVLQGVQDVNGLAKAINMSLESRLRQGFSKIPRR